MDFEVVMLYIRTDNGVPIQRQIGLGCGQDRTSFLWRPVKHVSCALANHDMIFSVLMGIGFHLCPQSIDWPHRVGKHGVQRWQAGFVAVIVLLFVKSFYPPLLQAFSSYSGSLFDFKQQLQSPTSSVLRVFRGRS